MDSSELENEIARGHIPTICATSGPSLQLRANRNVMRLKLLLQKLASSDPQPLKAIYVTAGSIQGLEGLTLAKLREMIEARDS